MACYDRSIEASQNSKTVRAAGIPFQKRNDMTSTKADLLPPLGVAAICAAALAIVAQLGPDQFGKVSNTTDPAIATAKAQSGTLTGNQLSGNALPRVTWQPQPAESTELTRIGFASCLRQDRAQPIWNAVIKAQPDTFLMLGDNVYGDFNNASGDKLISAYMTLANQPEFAHARAAFPMLATWDDHDYGLNDGGAEFEHKAVAEKLFRQFWQGSGSLKGVRGPGIAYAQSFGPPGRRVQIIMLDTRSFRSPLKLRPKDAPGKGKYQPDHDSAKTMLGEPQWLWLEQQLNEPADVRLIASSIQVVAEGHNFERWGNLPAEREKLYQLIDKTKAQGVVFLSGDRHRAAFYRQQRPGKSDIIEATSSSLNASFRDPNETGPYQLAPMLGSNNFGMVTIDWNARLLTLTLRDETGIAAEALAISFANATAQ